MAKKSVKLAGIRMAITVHAEAFKSDPFAARRMSHTLRHHYDDVQAVFEESGKVLAQRQGQNKGAGDWLSVDQIIALNDLRAKRHKVIRERLAAKRAARVNYVHTTDVERGGYYAGPV